MSGREDDGSSRGSRSELSGKFTRALNKLRPTLPIEDGKFTPDLRQVGLTYIQEEDGEFAKFVAGDSSQFATHGMNAEERKAATLKYDPEKDYLVDSKGKKASSDKLFYNVTREGDLIVQPKFTENFHHSSITRDGSVICAGHIGIEDGKIAYIDIDSGHYTPTDLDLYNAVNVLQKQAPQIFSEDAVAQGYQTMGIPLEEFTKFMEELIPDKSLMTSRIEVLRKQRIDEHLKISKKSEMIKFTGTISLKESIISTDLSSKLKVDKQYIFNFPKELFDSEYISEYAKKTYGKDGQEGKLSTLSLTSTELFSYLLRDKATNTATIDYLIKNGISNGKKFQENLLEFAQDVDVFKSLAKYGVENPGDNSTKMLYELSITAKDKDRAIEIADYLLGHENFEQTMSIVTNALYRRDIILKASEDAKKFVIDKLFETPSQESIGLLCMISTHRLQITERLLSDDKLSSTISTLDDYSGASLISQSSSETQGRAIAKLISEPSDIKSQKVLLRLSSNTTILDEKRAHIIQESILKPKLTKLLEKISTSSVIAEEDRKEFDKIKSSAVEIHARLNTKNSDLLRKHIGGIIREAAMRKGVTLEMKRTFKQWTSDIAHSLGYKKQERDIVKTMIGLESVKGGRSDISLPSPHQQAVKKSARF